MQKDSACLQKLEKGSNQIESEQEYVYGQSSSGKQILYYCPQEQNEDQLCPNFLTTHSLNQKNCPKSKQPFIISRVKPPRSIFHNYQKHLVTTLRQSIKIEKCPHQNQAQDLAHKLWSNFAQQTKIYTKNILQFVFGVLDFENEIFTNVYNEEILKKFGYGEIFAQYSVQMIGEAQGIIRKQVIKQMKEMDLNALFKTRRMKITHKFQQYVKQFVSELEEGPIRKRLPKVKKARMELVKKSI